VVSRERRAIVAGALIVVEGVLSIRIGFAPFEQRIAILTLVTGWIIAACGLLAWIRAPGSRVGILVVLAAAAWYLGGFRWLPVEPLAAACRASQLIYAALLTHAIVTFPTGRPWGRLSAACVFGAYVACLVPPPLGLLFVASALAMGLAMVVALADPTRSHERWPAVAPGLGLVVVLGGSPFFPVITVQGAAIDTRAVVQIAVAVTAMVLTAALVRASVLRSHVADLVVELEGPGRGRLARELAEAIGDPSAEVAYWLSEHGRYVDANGRTVTLPEPGAARRATIIERDGIPLAAILHEPGISADGWVRASIEHAAELSTANARLQEQVQARVADVQASRRRLLDAGDTERQELGERLRRDLEPRLSDLEVFLGRAGHAEPGTAGGESGLVAVAEHLRDARRELAELADGLHPRALRDGGLTGALADLAARSPVAVDLQVEPGSAGSPAAEATLFYVCSEALANVSKHSGASRAVVRLTRSGPDLVLEIVDDGAGGADAAHGSGILGLQDRVDVVGGQLQVRSRAGHGTSIVATVPAGDPPEKGSNRA
jgi:signal transduction histidine kinase